MVRDLEIFGVEPRASSVVEFGAVVHKQLLGKRGVGDHEGLVTGTKFERVDRSAVGSASRSTSSTRLADIPKFPAPFHHPRGHLERFEDVKRSQQRETRRRRPFRFLRA